MAHSLAREAEAELDQIWRYVAEQSGSLEIADRLIDLITERFFILSRYPHAGKLRPELSHGIRSFPVGEYVIVYRAEADQVRVLHVMHSSQDIRAIFK